jgi:hypothetical protein
MAAAAPIMPARKTPRRVNGNRNSAKIAPELRRSRKRPDDSTHMKLFVAIMSDFGGRRT